MYIKCTVVVFSVKKNNLVFHCATTAKRSPRGTYGCLNMLYLFHCRIGSCLFLLTGLTVLVKYSALYQVPLALARALSVSVALALGCC